MDAIAVTLATGGTYVGVAPLGTSLTDEQSAQLHQLGHRPPIVAPDADLAGRVAAERDYWILAPYQHDHRFARLPDGTDPADLVANGQTARLVDALTQARPLGKLLVDERFAHLPPAAAALEAVRVVAAQPAARWETGAQGVADRLQLPASLIRTALKDMVAAWNGDPRAAAQTALRDVTQVKARLARDMTTGTAETVSAHHVTGAEHARRDIHRTAPAPTRGIDR